MIELNIFYKNMPIKKLLEYLKFLEIDIYKFILFYNIGKAYKSFNVLLIQ
jgi:hypothetical protein